MSKKKTKLFKIKFSRAGMISILIFLGAVLFLLAAFMIAFRTYGHGDTTVAALGFLALFLSILGLILPIRDGRLRAKEESFPLLSKVAVVLNTLAILGILAIYIIGIVI